MVGKFDHLPGNALRTVAHQAVLFILIIIPAVLSLGSHGCLLLLLHNGAVFSILLVVLFIYNDKIFI